MTKPILNWEQCYKGGWKNEIVPAAFQHPAKYSRKLIARIYNHLIVAGLIHAGDRIVDPFGGVALGALDAMRLGLHWTGVELEPKFHALGNENIALWNARYATMPNWGTAQLLNGDSRRLAQIVEGARAAVSSPPYSEGLGHTGKNTEIDIKKGLTGFNDHYGKSKGQLGAVPEGDFNAAISSPPYAETRISAEGGGNEKNMRRSRTGTRYGLTPGQLGSLKDGDFAAAISSPPYEGARIGNESGAGNVGRSENYGESDGQLGSMEAGDFAAAVSSPPYEKGATGHLANIKDVESFARVMTERDGKNRRHKTTLQARMAQIEREAEKSYGDTDGNLGNDSGETFWLASRTILEELHAVLAPRGIAVFVCKDFVRNRERVPFCDQWRELGEAVGFEHLYTARAWMVEDHGTQMAHDGNHKPLRKERKSFFRRLNEKNGGPRIDWEEVIFMQKEM